MSCRTAFGDKHELFLRALDAYVEQVIRPALRELDGPPPVVPRLRRVLKAVRRAAAEHPGRGCLLVRTGTECVPHDAVIAERTRAAFGEVEAAYRKVFDRAHGHGELRIGTDTGAAAALLALTVSGLQVVAQGDCAPERLDAAVDLLVDSLVAPSE